MSRLLPCLALALVLTACSAAAPTSSPAATQTVPAPAPVSSVPPANQEIDMVRIDQQGMVVVAASPPDLATRGDTLEFELTLDTHSVDLSMDLAALATLTTDAGSTVVAKTWDAPRGGHHVTGKLIFPATTADGRPLLQGASSLTLSIVNLDAPLREFVWDLK